MLQCGGGAGGKVGHTGKLASHRNRFYSPEKVSQTLAHAISRSTSTSSPSSRSSYLTELFKVFGPLYFAGNFTLSDATFAGLTGFSLLLHNLPPSEIFGPFQTVVFDNFTIHFI